MDTMERLLTTPSSDGILRAELWADSLITVLSCWIPLALAGIVVGGNILGSSLECFPTYLASAVRNNVTDNVNGSSAGPGFRDPRLYSSQLDEFVNSYCGKLTSFDYRVFAIMLVAQSAVMFAPQLVWNITTAREVICNLNFIRQYLEALYKTKKPKGVGTPYKPKLSEQTRLIKFVENLLGSSKIYWHYLAKQIFTTISITVFLLAFCSSESAKMRSIQDNFNCTVSQDFIVHCSMSSASLYRFAWGINIFLIAITWITFFVHMYYLHFLIDHNPFTDVGITFDEPVVIDPESSSNSKFINATDCHLMYTFLKANIDVIEKYNYTAILHETEEDQPEGSGGMKLQETTVKYIVPKPNVRRKKIKRKSMPRRSYYRSPSQPV